MTSGTLSHSSRILSMTMTPTMRWSTLHSKRMEWEVRIGVLSKRVERQSPSRRTLSDLDVALKSNHHLCGSHCYHDHGGNDPEHSSAYRLLAMPHELNELQRSLLRLSARVLTMVPILGIRPFQSLLVPTMTTRMALTKGRNNPP